MNPYFDTHFFLGANTEKGFFSLYDNFINSDNGDFLYVLKGGPGCGKSTFMKTIANNLRGEGITAEYIHCSGDPASLDGVYFPSLKTAFVDGTAPHIIEPEFTGVSGAYINIGQFYDCSKLRKYFPQIRSTSAAYKTFYTKAYACLSAAASVSNRFTSSFLTESARKNITRRAAGISEREFKKTKNSNGKITYRFISAISCDGILNYFDTVNILAKRVYVLENNIGLAPYMLEILKSHAVHRGYNVIVCLSPIIPDIIEHIIIPELSLAFISQTAKTQYPFEAARHIRLDVIPDSITIKKLRPKFKRYQKIYNMLIDEALENLFDAGALHDELEKIYNPFVDFTGVEKLAQIYTNELLRNSVIS